MVADKWTRYLYRGGDNHRYRDGREVLSDKGFRAAPGSFDAQIIPAGRMAPRWARDLLRVAKAVYLADRAEVRDRADDKWTRSFDLRIQVEDCAPWRGPILDSLSLMLRILTSDHWNIELIEGATDQGPPDALPGFQKTVGEVALFSGGVDSTCYAAGRSAASEQARFVCYTIPKLKKRQYGVYARVIGAGVDERLRAISALATSRELTNRSRGLLFVTTAVYVAAAFRCGRVIIPENGQLAINPPLTGARIGACSTRSVHPLVLSIANEIVRSIGGDVEINNPYLRYTKAEVCKKALASGISEDVLIDTVSCSHPPLVRSGGRFFHCGYCFPCMIRRSALVNALGRDCTPYAVNFWEIPWKNDKASDVYAVLNWLNRSFSQYDVIADVALPQNLSVAETLSMLQRGRDDLSFMIDELVPPNHSFRRLLASIPE